MTYYIVTNDLGVEPHNHWEYSNYDSALSAAQTYAVEYEGQTFQIVKCKVLSNVSYGYPKPQEKQFTITRDGMTFLVGDS